MPSLNPRIQDQDGNLNVSGERAAFIQGFTPAQVDGTEGKEIPMKIGGNEIKFKGMQYLLGFACPNFYFHVTSAYNILRHNGVEVGKRDFIGTP